MIRRQKGVVYCRSRSQCVATAEAIGCASHHNGISEAERAAGTGGVGERTGAPVDDNHGAGYTRQCNPRHLSSKNYP